MERSEITYTAQLWTNKWEAEKKVVTMETLSFFFSLFWLLTMIIAYYMQHAKGF